MHFYVLYHVGSTAPPCTCTVYVSKFCGVQYVPCILYVLYIPFKETYHSFYLFLKNESTYIVNRLLKN